MDNKQTSVSKASAEQLLADLAALRAEKTHFQHAVGQIKDSFSASRHASYLPSCCQAGISSIILLRMEAYPPRATDPLLWRASSS